MNSNPIRHWWTRSILATLLISCSSHSLAEVFRCQDSSGKTTYSDTQCKADDTSIDISGAPDVTVLPFKTAEKLDDDVSKVIYTGKVTGRNSRFLRVSIYEETDAYMIFKVEGYYNGPSTGRAEFRVMPNISWRANAYSTSDKGAGSGFSRVALGSGEGDTATSDIITLQLWYYSPANKASVVETKVIPYKKHWVKER